MLKESTIQLLRFHFSFFLMPVYFFALSQAPQINWLDAVAIFFILHGLVYPASNGYNSYMDRDDTPIGGIENPMQPTKELFWVTVVMDIVAIFLSLLVSTVFAFGVLAYIAASRAYSYRGIRLKKYPIIGFITVLLFQGTLVFFLVYHGASTDKLMLAPTYAMAAAGLLMGSFYPLTQVYQHEFDRKDGVLTLSMLLGIRGTFIFTAIIYAAAMLFLLNYFSSKNQIENFIWLSIFLLPVLVYFFIWLYQVWKDPRQADFKHTMRMNLLASFCSNLAFLSILIGRFL